MSTATALTPGTRVLVPWGLGDPREAVVVEVWGDPTAPSHIRVEFAAETDGDDVDVLLLDPKMVTIAA